MDDTTFNQAKIYKEQLSVLAGLQAQLAVPATQKIIDFGNTGTSMATIDDAMTATLVAQAVILVDDQIVSVQALFAAL